MPTGTLINKKGATRGPMSPRGEMDSDRLTPILTPPGRLRRPNRLRRFVEQSPHHADGYSNQQKGPHKGGPFC